MPSDDSFIPGASRFVLLASLSWVRTSGDVSVVSCSSWRVSLLSSTDSMAPMLGLSITGCLSLASVLITAESSSFTGTVLGGSRPVSILFYFFSGVINTPGIRAVECVCFCGGVYITPATCSMIISLSFS